MPHIQTLEPHVADLIAAGEVVERPASVVKELVENAIDAGASTVTVEIQHGGMTLIRVTDDGCGIAAGEAETAFLRHATSKIRTEYDLEAIGTLGFRGEALAAIAAVSRVDLLTRTAEERVGISLELEGGAVLSREEAGCPQGTTMVVRDLFYNTPARLKFMKKDSAEGAAAFAAVQRQALSHPEVSVRFLRDGKQELLTPGDGQLKSAVYSVLGRDLALGFLPVTGSGEEMAVTGFVSRPNCCRGTRGYQHFFVNGRYVKSRTMMAALEEAYANQRMVGKFPGCVLHLTTKLNAVDVNVHPTKQEVKFSSERKVFDAVYYAVKSALEGDRTRPAAVLEPPRPEPEEHHAPPPPEPAVSAAPAPEPEPWRLAGEVLSTYIIVEQGDKVVLIDKHAAHERMHFDKLRAEGYTPMCQVLLTPAVVTPSAQEGAVLLDNLPLLERFGFQVEEFGGGALVVRACPDYVDAGDIENTLSELAGKLLATGRADPAAARDAVLHTMACKAAIKGGQKNGPDELRRVADAVMSGAVKYCPHGRPVAIELTRRQLEKQFKRA